jgi:hypothetical protein
MKLKVGPRVQLSLVVLDASYQLATRDSDGMRLVDIPYFQHILLRRTDVDGQERT